MNNKRMFKRFLSVLLAVAMLATASVSLVSSAEDETPSYLVTGKGSLVYQDSYTNSVFDKIADLSDVSGQYVAILLVDAYENSNEEYRLREIEIHGKNGNLLSGENTAFTAERYLKNGDQLSVYDGQYWSTVRKGEEFLTGADQSGAFFAYMHDGSGDHVDVQIGAMMSLSGQMAFVYDLGSVQDITKIRVLSGTSDNQRPIGVKMYVSETLEDLFSEEDSETDPDDEPTVTPVNLLRDGNRYTMTPAALHRGENGAADTIIYSSGALDYANPLTANRSWDLVDGVYWTKNCDFDLNCDEPLGWIFDLGASHSLTQIKVFVENSEYYNTLEIYAAENKDDLINNPALNTTPYAQTSKDDEATAALIKGGVAVTADDWTKTARYVAVFVTGDLKEAIYHAVRIKEIEIYGVRTQAAATDAQLMSVVKEDKIPEATTVFGGTAQKIRYVAFFKTDGDSRVRELGAYNNSSTNLLNGITPVPAVMMDGKLILAGNGAGVAEYATVVTQFEAEKNDPEIEDLAKLVDGDVNPHIDLQHIGNATENTQYGLLYDLGEEKDVSSVSAMFGMNRNRDPNCDYPDGMTVYAAATLAELGYEDPTACVDKFDGGCTITLSVDGEVVVDGENVTGDKIAAGTEVTVTVKPGENYGWIAPGSLKVLDLDAEKETVLAIPERVGFQTGNKQDTQYTFKMPAQNVRVVCDFMVSNASAQNQIGHVGYQVKNTEDNKGLRSIFRLNVTKEDGTYKLGGETVKDFGILTCTATTADGKNAQQLYAAADEEGAKIVKTSFKDSNVRFDVCNSYEDISVAVVGLDETQQAAEITTVAYVVLNDGEDTVVFTELQSRSYNATAGIIA